MVECERADLVCLYLDAHADARDRTPAPRAVTAAGVGDALEIGDTASARVRLLDDLATLREEGLVEAVEREVAGLDEPRTVYLPTPAGRERADDLRGRLRDEPVTVETDGATEEVPLSAVGRYFEDERAPLVRALARLTGDGRVPLGEGPADEFVNREAALETVVDAVAGSFTRGSRTVAVEGPAGMGKTALVREALDRVQEDHPDLVVAEGSSPSGATDPYTAFRRAFDALPSGEDLLGRLDDASLAGPPAGPERLRVRRTALFDDVADGLRAVAGEQPVVLVLENLQWADEATLQLFAHLATTIDEWVYPVAFVGTYRPPVGAADDHPLWDALDRIERGGAFDTVDLDPLTRGDVAALLARLVGRQELPDGFVDLVFERTGGNPLFVHETVAHLRETGDLDPEAGAFPTSQDAVSLPGEVAEQVERRVARLDEPSRELLRLGAVIGDQVPRRVLAAASSLEPARHREYVDTLVASRFWEPAGGGPRSRGDVQAGDGQGRDRVDGTRAGPSTGVDREAVSTDGGVALQFASGGVREAVVERMPDGLAADYHGRVAEALVAVHGDDLADRAARVAHHYERAGDHAAAVEHYRRAGDHAAAAYANEDAVENYDRALELAATHGLLDDAALAALRAELADVYATTGAFDDAREVAADGLEDAPERSRERCRLLGLLAEADTEQGAYDEARETTHRQRSLAADVGARDLEAAAIRRLGWIAQQQGAYDDARDHLERGLEMARDLGDRRMEAETLNDLGTVAWRQGDYDAAGDYHERALGIQRDLEDRPGEAKSLNNLGLVAWHRGEHERTREYFAESLAIRRDVGDRNGEISALNNLGLVARFRGEHERARERLEESLALARQVGDRQGEANCLNNLGIVARQQGDLDEARAYYADSLAVKRELGDRQGVANTLENLGTVANEQAAYDRAREYYEDSLALVRELGDSNGEANTLAGLGTVAERQGDYREALARYEESLAIRRHLGDRTAEAKALVNLGSVERHLGNGDRARDCYEDGLAVAEDLDAPSETARAHLGLAAVARDGGDPSAAREHVEAAADLVAGDGSPALTAGVALEEALVALAAGDLERAQDRARDAREAFADLGAAHRQARARRVLGRVAADRGDEAGAREHLTAALETFERVDAPQDALAALEPLVAMARGAGDEQALRKHCGRARALLAEVPDPVADDHRDWVASCPGGE